MHWLSKQLEISRNNHSPLRPMEGLRGIAVFLVFLVHYCSQIKPYITNYSIEGIVLHILQRLGNIGVDLFFVLSGFLIYGALINKDRIGFYQYIQRRIIRIYPTFIVVFCIYLLLSLMLPNENKIPSDIWNGSVYIIQNLLLLPGLFDINPMIKVAWSLSYEFFYYISIPLIIALLRLKKWNVKQRIKFWFIVSVIGLICFEIYGGPTRLLMFISGIILFEVYKNKLLELPKYSGTLCFIAALTLYSFGPNLNLSGVMLTGVLYILFFITCLESFSKHNGSALFLNLYPIRWLGNMSYSYYLVHGLTLKACFFSIALFIEPEKQFETLFWFAMPFLFATTLVTSFVLFILIEKPFSLSVNLKKQSTNIETGEKNTAG